MARQCFPDPGTDEAVYDRYQIVHITDTYDLTAQLKIAGAYDKHLGYTGIHANPRIVAASSATLIGPLVSELLTNEAGPDRQLIAVNYAPPNNSNGTTNNRRKNFYFADIVRPDDSGTENIVVGGTSNGLEFSYIKPWIKQGSFFELISSNNGSQFRSLEILPEALVEFGHPNRYWEFNEDGTPDESKFKQVDNIDDIIPSVPDVTHVFEVDNFGNVKLYLSDKDRELLNQARNTPIQIAFGNAAIEAGGDLTKQEFGVRYKALATENLFDGSSGTNVLAWNSSSSLIGDRNVPILATLRDRPAETSPNYTPPKVGAPAIITYG